MCGRFAVLETVPDLALRFAFRAQAPLPALPAYNVAPSQNVLVVRLQDGERIAHALVWGLIPSWAKDPTIGRRMINARSETASVKPAFRTPLALRRCLVPASGFFEWRRCAGRASPHFFRPARGGAFAFAGLWESWRSPEGPAVESVTLLTTQANSLVAPIHDRMPVILSPEDEATWLRPDVSLEKITQLLRPLAAPGWEVFAVTPRMNAPGYSAPDAVSPLPGGQIQ